MTGHMEKKRVRLDDRLAWEHYNAGETDAQIAEALGVHKNTVNNWRRRQKLLSNCPQNRAKEIARRKGRELSPLEQDVRAAREAGLTYGQYKAQQYIKSERMRLQMDRLRKNGGGK